MARKPHRCSQQLNEVENFDSTADICYTYCTRCLPDTVLDVCLTQYRAIYRTQYDTTCYFSSCSKVGRSQFNLLHGNKKKQKTT